MTNLFIFRSFESLAEDLTRILEDRVSGAVRNIYSTIGKKVSTAKIQHYRVIKYIN